MDTRPSGRERQVLLVDPDPSRRDELGSWLEDAGFGVIECPGPPGAGMVCLGQRGEACGLVDFADLLVLDLSLVPDAVNQRTAGRRLLRYYLGTGKPVVLVSGRRHSAGEYRDEQVAVIEADGGLTRDAFLKVIERVEGDEDR